MKNSRSVYWLFLLALLIFPCLTSGQTDSLPSGLVTLPACLFAGTEPYSPRPYPQTPASAFPNSGSSSRVSHMLLPPEEIWDERIWPAGPGTQSLAPDQSISHKVMNCWGQVLVSQCWPRGFLDALHSGSNRPEANPGWGIQMKPYKRVKLLLTCMSPNCNNTPDIKDCNPGLGAYISPWCLLRK